MTRRLLYLSADGLLEPLGFSQVLRVVEGLAQRGWPYDVHSLEKSKDLQRESRVREVRARLSALGVRWSFDAYLDGGSARAALNNERALVRAASSTSFAGIHARAYHAGMAAFGAWLSRRTPYLFDARSYWFDERLEEGRWLTSPLRVAVARGIEHQLFARAAGVVTLTELQADDVRGGRFGRPQQRSVTCIPTCADFDDFRLQHAASRVPEEARAALLGRKVLGIVGSVNRSYLVDETLELCARVLSQSPHARLLILSGQRDEYERRLERLRVPPEQVVMTRADHEAMPDWLSLIDWGMLLLNASSPAKRASMPTKLAEFLAAGVRPVQFGCNDEVSSWVRRTGSGFVLEGVDSASLDAAARHICAAQPDEATLVRARDAASPHFSLRAGVERYEQVLLTTFGDLRRGARPS